MISILKIVSSGKWFLSLLFIKHTSFIWKDKSINLFYSITRDNASPNLTMMAEFKKQYFEHFKRKFTGEIPCTTHVINLIVQDIMGEIKAKPPKNDEIADIIREAETIRRQETFPEPCMYFILPININWLIFLAALPMPTIAKVRRIIVLLKYSQYYARLLRNQNQANNIQGRQKVGLDTATRWNSTCEYCFDKLHFAYIE
jgi:hypothetical protein